MPRVLAIFLVAFLLNIVWEKIQMPLYAVDVSVWECWMLCLKASIWDAFIIAGVYYFVDTPNQNQRYILSVILCLLIAIFIEQRALVEGRWTYSSRMPTIAGIGLSPLIQLPLLAIATYEILRRRKGIVSI